MEHLEKLEYLLWSKDDKNIEQGRAGAGKETTSEGNWGCKYRYVGYVSLETGT